MKLTLLAALLDLLATALGSSSLRHLGLGCLERLGASQSIEISVRMRQVDENRKGSRGVGVWSGRVNRPL